MKYKLIVLDLDGTLTNSKKVITPRNREILIRVQEQGVRLVLASGRPTYGIVPLANELRMNEFGGFILSYNGGEIINWETQEMLYENVLPNDVVPVLYECARSHQLSILTYDGAEIVTENSQDPYVQKEAFLNKMAVRETNDFLTDITLPVAKCLIVGDADKLIPLEAELCLRLQGRINVFRSEPYFLELVPQGIDKALSLAVLLKEKAEQLQKDIEQLNRAYTAGTEKITTVQKELSTAQKEKWFRHARLPCTWLKITQTFQHPR